MQIWDEEKHSLKLVCNKKFIDIDKSYTYKK